MKKDHNCSETMRLVGCVQRQESNIAGGGRSGFRRFRFQPFGVGGPKLAKSELRGRDAIGNGASGRTLGCVDGEGGLIIEFHAVAGSVEQTMMGAAEQDQAIEICAAAVDPVVDVMNLAMFRKCAATGGPAVEIASDDRSALRRGGGSNFATEVEDLVARHEDSLDDGIAGESDQRRCPEVGSFRGDPGSAPAVAGAVDSTGSGPEFADIDDERHMRLEPPMFARPIAMVESEPACLDESRRATLRRSASRFQRLLSVLGETNGIAARIASGVRVAVACIEHTQGCFDDRGVCAIEGALHHHVAIEQSIAVQTGRSFAKLVGIIISDGAFLPVFDCFRSGDHIERREERNNSGGLFGEQPDETVRDARHNRIDLCTGPRPIDPGRGDLRPSLEAFIATSLTRRVGTGEAARIGQPGPHRTGPFIAPKFMGIETHRCLGH